MVVCENNTHIIYIAQVNRDLFGVIGIKNWNLKEDSPFIVITENQ
jgi:hypothetical protein